jgi:hypothetical protein
MRVVKFLTKEGKATSDDWLHEHLDYFSFGVQLEAVANSNGIRVVPIKNDIDLSGVVLTKTMLLLEVDETDITYCDNNGNMRVRKAVPIRQITKADKEWGIIRSAACRNPWFSYEFAHSVDEESNYETRNSASKMPEFAYLYAVYVDKRPIEDTMIGASKEKYWEEAYFRVFRTYNVFQCSLNNKRGNSTAFRNIIKE